jgi:hypothetical protein
MLPFANRDRMVEQFVEGRMEGSELRAFQKMLAGDPKLQRMVETERAIRGTLMRDRNHIPTDDPRGRAHLLAMLATLPSEPIGIAAGTAAQGGAPQGGASAVGTVMKGLAIVATGAVLTVGAIFGVRALDDAPATTPVKPAPVQMQYQAAPAETPQSARAEQPAAAVPAQSPALPVEASEAAPARVAERSPRQRTTATTAVERNRTRTAVEEPAPQVDRKSDEVAAPQTEIQDQPRRKPVVVLPDTMRVNVMIEMDGGK